MQACIVFFFGQPLQEISTCFFDNTKACVCSSTINIYFSNICWANNKPAGSSWRIRKGLVWKARTVLSDHIWFNEVFSLFQSALAIMFADLSIMCDVIVVLCRALTIMCGCFIMWGHSAIRCSAFVNICGAFKLIEGSLSVCAVLM